VRASVWVRGCLKRCVGASLSVPLLSKRRREGKRCMRGKGRGQQCTNEGGYYSRKARESSHAWCHRARAAPLQRVPGVIRGRRWSRAPWAFCTGAARRAARYFLRISIVQHGGVCGVHESREGVPLWLRCSRRLSLTLWRARGCGCGCAAQSRAPRSIARPCKENMIFFVRASSGRRDGVVPGARAARA
jgi:hypothetical protein